MEPHCAAPPFPFARETACTTWGEVFDAVQNGDAQFGVLPFENSNAGDVSTVLDLLYTHPDIIIARMVRPADPAGPAGRAGRDAGDGQDRHQPPAGAGPEQRFCTAARL